MLRQKLPDVLSGRRPKMHSRFNNADNIKRGLEEDGHRTWALVIYRCTYNSDDNWNTFMKRLRQRIRNTLDFYDGIDLMDSLSLTVFEDWSLFDGTSTSVVREHFKQWAITAPQQEQGTGPALSQRYRYCVQVDGTALKSVLEDDDPLPHISDGFVNLIWNDDRWKHTNRVPGREEVEVEEPIEGCTLHNVGWMRVAYQDVILWWTSTSCYAT